MVECQTNMDFTRRLAGEIEITLSTETQEEASFAKWRKRRLCRRPNQSVIEMLDWCKESNSRSAAKCQTEKKKNDK